jgi:hypothetical protein
MRGGDGEDETACEVASPGLLEVKEDEVIVTIWHCFGLGWFLGVLVWLPSAVAQAPPLVSSHRLAGANATFSATVGCVSELVFDAKVESGDCFLDNEIDAVFTEPGGRQARIPAFWAGGGQWKVRYAPRTGGTHAFRIMISAGEATVAGELTGTLDAATYSGANPLFKHGPVHLSENKRYFAHADGTPFFWLADSWWHGMTSRLTFDGFKTLVADRKAKGFNVIQFAVANPCDIAPFDERGGSEAGHAWTKDFGTINPAYWDLTDQRISYLIEQGLMPSIVGSWGYYINFMDMEKMQKHWRYIVARYGAFPVAWTLCGESRLPWYPNIGKGDQGYQQTLKWADVGSYLAKNNPTGRLIGIHPGPPLWFHDAAYEALPDYSFIDVYFGMGGHGGTNEYMEILRGLRTMDTWRKSNPGKVALIGELAWEGMMGGACGPYAQRIQFWGSVLRGSPGHCYGTDSLWQMNCKDKPFGQSASGFTWGNWPWEEAMHWPGSTYVSVGKRILEKYEWWKLESHPDWLSNPEDEKNGAGLLAAAAGLPNGTRFCYLARKGKQKLLKLQPGAAYSVTFISPLDGKEYCACLASCAPDCR